MKEELPEGFKSTEIGPIPEEWEVVKVSEIAEKLRAGGTPSRKESKYWGGDIPFVLIEDMTSTGLYLSNTREYITEEGLSNSSAWIVPSNSLLLSMYATIGETAINAIPLATNQAILAILPKSNFDIVYGAYRLKYDSKRLSMQNVQSTQKNVNKGIVENFRISLPPLPEQKKIATVLSVVQLAKEKTEDVLTGAKDLKKSLMNYLFTNGPVPVEDVENVPLKETEIGMVPEEWDVVKVGDVVEGTQYGISMRGNQQGQYPILRMNNLIDGRVDTSDLQYVDLNDDEFRKFQLKEGDILFNRTNSHELVGKTALFRSGNECIFASYLVRVVPDRAHILPGYMNYCLNWNTTQTRLRMLASRGVSQSNISASKLRSFRIPVPALPVQERIIDTLGCVDGKIMGEEDRKKALEELFKTLLHNLMTAKMRVNDLEAET